MLLTRSRLCPGPKPGSSLHLHVLSTPPAFVLSQDQTLREELLAHRPGGLRTVTKSSSVTLVWPRYTRRHGHDGSILAAGTATSMPDGSNLDAHIGSWEIRGAHAVEFSKTAAPFGRGLLR